MTENEQIRAFRGQLQAVQMCRAVSAGDPAAAMAMFTAEADAGTLKELTSGLATMAVALARTVATHDATIDEDAVWFGFASSAETGLLVTAEIDSLTSDPGPEPDGQDGEQ